MRLRVRGLWRRWGGRRCVFFGPTIHPSISFPVIFVFLEGNTFALQISKVTLDPAQLRTSVAKRFGSGSSYTHTSVLDQPPYLVQWNLTIGCPFSPTIKSNHGSRGSSPFLLRRTWKPNEVLSPVEWRGSRGASESRRPIKRLRAPNMVICLGVLLFGLWKCT